MRRSSVSSFSRSPGSEVSSASSRRPARSSQATTSSRMASTSAAASRSLTVSATTGERVRAPRSPEITIRPRPWRLSSSSRAASIPRPARRSGSTAGTRQAMLRIRCAAGNSRSSRSTANSRHSDSRCPRASVSTVDHVAWSARARRSARSRSAAAQPAVSSQQPSATPRPSGPRRATSSSSVSARVKARSWAVSSNISPRPRSDPSPRGGMRRPPSTTRSCGGASRQSALTKEGRGVLVGQLVDVVEHEHDRLDVGVEPGADRRRMRLRQAMSVRCTEPGARCASRSGQTVLTRGSRERLGDPRRERLNLAIAGGQCEQVCRSSPRQLTQDRRLAVAAACDDERHAPLPGFLEQLNEPRARDDSRSCHVTRGARCTLRSRDRRPRHHAGRIAPRGARLDVLLDRKRRERPGRDADG